MKLKTKYAISRVYVEENDQEVMIEETITVLIPNEKMAKSFTMDFMDMDDEMNLTQVEGRTQIRTNLIT